MGLGPARLASSFAGNKFVESISWKRRILFKFYDPHRRFRLRWIVSQSCNVSRVSLDSKFPRVWALLSFFSDAINSSYRGEKWRIEGWYSSDKLNYIWAIWKRCVAQSGQRKESSSCLENWDLQKSWHKHLQQQFFLSRSISYISLPLTHEYKYTMQRLLYEQSQHLITLQPVYSPMKHYNGRVITKDVRVHSSLFHVIIHITSNNLERTFFHLKKTNWIKSFDTVQVSSNSFTALFLNASLSQLSYLCTL